MSDPFIRPVLIYDGDCGFCRGWILRWESVFRGRVTCAPYQEVAEQFPEISPQRFDRSIQFIEPDGRVSEGAEAVFRALAYDESTRWPLWVYLHVLGFAPVAEWIYRFVADRRSATGFRRDR